MFDVKNAGPSCLYNLVKDQSSQVIPSRCFLASFYHLFSISVLTSAVHVEATAAASSGAKVINLFSHMMLE